jgi:hypothetical protein
MSGARETQTERSSGLRYELGTVCPSFESDGPRMDQFNGQQRRQQGSRDRTEEAGSSKCTHIFVPKT